MALLQKGNTLAKGHGRPKGSLNYTTVEVREFCRLVCQDQAYREDILNRARTNTLGPMEPWIWFYAWGKPRERLEVSVVDNPLASLSVTELMERASCLMRDLREAEEVEIQLKAIDVCSQPVLPEAQGEQADERNAPPED